MLSNLRLTHCDCLGGLTDGRIKYSELYICFFFGGGGGGLTDGQTKYTHLYSWVGEDGLKPMCIIQSAITALKTTLTFSIKIHHLKDIFILQAFNFYSPIFSLIISCIILF